MTRLRAWLNVAVIVVAMLAGIGAWEVYKGTMKPTRDAYAASFDHFKCYDITPGGPALNQAVTLFDQFHPAPDGEKAVVRVPRLLCTPTFKVVGP